MKKRKLTGKRTLTANAKSAAEIAREILDGTAPEEIETMVRDTQVAMARFAGVLRRLMGKPVTVVDLAESLAQEFFEPGDPYRLFLEWLSENRGRIREAVADLGVEMPERSLEGPEFFVRLKDAVAPVLVERYRERSRESESGGGSP